MPWYSNTRITRHSFNKQIHKTKALSVRKVCNCVSYCWKGVLGSLSCCSCFLSRLTLSTKSLHVFSKASVFFWRTAFSFLIANISDNKRVLTTLVCFRSSSIFLSIRCSVAMIPSSSSLSSSMGRLFLSVSFAGALAESTISGCGSVHLSFALRLRLDPSW